jgi:hypothetical protein
VTHTRAGAKPAFSFQPKAKVKLDPAKRLANLPKPTYPDDLPVVARREEIAQPLPVPSTAIWSASDGLVNGHLCHDPQCREIEIVSSHMRVQMHPETLRAIAGVLGGETKG